MATANPFTSAQAPSAMSVIAPDLAMQQIQLARQQQLADLLRQQSLTPMGSTEMVGGWAIPKSPLEGLSKVAQALGSRYSQDNIDAKNLDLGKSMQQRMADILGGSSSNPSGALAAGAVAQPSTPGADGQMVNQGGVGPTVSNAARLTSQPAPANNFNMGNLVRGSVISELGGAPAGAAYWSQFQPTELQKTDAYLGIDPNASRSAELAKRLKAGYIPPTRLSQGAYADPTGTLHGLPAPAPAGFINIPDPTDASGYKTVKIGGGPQAVQEAAKAKTAGEGEVLPYSGVDVNGNPLPLTNRTAAATQGSAPQPQPGVSGDFKGDPAQVSAAIEAIKDPQERANARAAFEVQMKKTNGALPPLASGPIYGAPPMGATSGADASQKAPAQSMKESYAKLQSSRASAQSATDAIDKMLALASKKSPLFTAGVLGTHQSAVNPDAAEYEKQRANLITQLAAQNGTNGTDAGRALTGESVPDFGKPKSAIADGLGTLRNQTVVQQLKADLLTPAYQAGDSKKYTTLENEFDQHVAPSMVPLLTMPAGPERAAKLTAAAKDPTMRAKLTWAAEHGLLK